MKTHVKKGDQVQVTVGGKKIKGKTGTVLSVDAAKGQVLVEGVRMIKKAVRRSEKNPDGGIIETEGPIHISNVKKLG
jgi:large subunit ribosomal protein L24